MFVYIKPSVLIFFFSTYVSTQSKTRLWLSLFIILPSFLYHADIHLSSDFPQCKLVIAEETVVWARDACHTIPNIWGMSNSSVNSVQHIWRGASKRQESSPCGNEAGAGPWVAKIFDKGTFQVRLSYTKMKIHDLAFWVIAFVIGSIII